MRPIRRGILAFVVILTCVAVPTPCFAQSEFKNGKGEVADLTIDTEGESQKMVWVAAAGYRPRYLPHMKDTDVVPGVQFKFMQPCFVADTWQDETGIYHFVGSISATNPKKIAPFGWVHEKLLVEQPFAKKVAGTGTDRLGSGLSQKVMIINTVESIRRGRELFILPKSIQTDLERMQLSEPIYAAFSKSQLPLTKSANLQRGPTPGSWIITDTGSDGLQRFELTPVDAGYRVADSLAQAAVFDSPLTDPVPNRLTTFRLYNIFFVYREFSLDPDDDKATWVLIGTRNEFTSSPTQEEASKIVRGWIRRDRLSYWNTRECLAWDMDTIQPDAKPQPRDRGTIWNHPDDAQRWLDGMKTAREPLFTEALNSEGKPIRFGPGDPRFAVLTESKDKRSTSSNNRLANVGVVGSLDGGNSADLESQRQDIIAKLTEAQESLKIIELVFVIDDSESMRHAFRPVGDVVSQTLTQLLSFRKDRDLTLKVGFTFYSDHPAAPPIIAGNLQLVFDPSMTGPQAEAAIEQLVDGNEVKQNGVIVRPQGIRTHQFRAGGELPEMVFEGIHEGISKFSPNPTRKILIHLGDHCDSAGGKRPEDNVDDLTTDEENEVRALVNRVFPAKRSPLEFYSIQVMAENGDPRKPHMYAKRLSQEMDRLCGLANQKAKEITGNADYQIARFVPNANIKLLQSSINTRLEQLLKESVEWQQQLTALRLGEWNTQVAPGLLVQLRDKKIPFDELRKFEGAQLYSEGCVWIRARGTEKIDQVRVQYLLNRADLQQVVLMLKTLVGSDTRRIDKPEVVRTLIKEVVKSMTGEDESPLTIDEAFQQAFGIKFGSGIFKKRPEDVKNGLTEEERRELRLKYEILRDLHERSARRDWHWVKSVDQDSGATLYKLELKTPDDPQNPDRDRVKRFFKQPGSEVEWIYLDEKELP